MKLELIKQFNDAYQEKNYAEALKIFLKTQKFELESSPSPDELYKLALEYKDEIEGLDPAHVKFVCFHEAAKEGHVLSKFQVAKYYLPYSGPEGLKGKQKAISILEEIKDEKDCPGEAYSILGNYYYSFFEQYGNKDNWPENKKDEINAHAEKAQELFLEGVEKKDIDSILGAGSMFLNLEGKVFVKENNKGNNEINFAQNYIAARKLFQSTDKHPLALYYLGCMTRDGKIYSDKKEHFVANPVTAIEIFELSGTAPAYYAIAQIYEHGAGNLDEKIVKQDLNKAIKYYKLSYKTSPPTVISSVFKAKTTYENGKSNTVKVSQLTFSSSFKEKALEKMNYSNADDVIFANYQYGMELIEQGNFEEGMEHLKIAVEYKFPQAWYQYALLIKKNEPETAYQLFKELAEKGDDPRAWYQCGLYLETQENSKPEEIIACYKKAARFPRTATLIAPTIGKVKKEEILKNEEIHSKKLTGNIYNSKNKDFLFQTGKGNVLGNTNNISNNKDIREDAKNDFSPKNIFW